MKIAILREAGGLGDVVATEPAVRGLKQKYPQAEIWYAGLPEYREVLEMWRVKPDVYYEVERAKRRDRDAKPDFERWAYLEAFKNFELIIDLFCPAYKYERQKKNLTDKSRVELFCEAAGVPFSAPRIAVDESKQEWARGWLCGKGTSCEKPLVAIQPISCGRRRNWRRKNWQQLQKNLAEKGVQVVVFHTYAEAVKGIDGIKAVGLRTLEMAALLNECSLAITPDSGLLHLSAALGVPTLSLWGSTSPGVTLKGYPQAEFIWKNDSALMPHGCSVPCYSMNGCLSKKCLFECALLEKILPVEVEVRALELLRMLL